VPMTRKFSGVAVCVLVLFPTLAHAQQKFVAALRSEQEVPANPSAATGTCTATLIEAAPFLTASCTYSGLESRLVAGHIHGSAAVGVNAPVMIDLMPPTGGTSGSFIRQPLSITPKGVTALRSNLLYINFHSSSLPGGEIRGQLKSTKTVFDLDGDGRTDPVIFRSSTETFWTAAELERRAHDEHLRPD
jgi:hypothetical protein